MPSAIFEIHRRAISKPIPLKPTTKKDAVYRTALNRLLPVLQLCPDVLEYLFLLAAGMEQNSTSLRRSVMSYSQTCHDWRLVALATKRLWALLVDFEDNSRQWNDEMLRRSHPLPIRLSYNADFSRGRDALSLQLDQLPRIQTYSLGCQDTDWDALVSMLSRPAPILQDLYIICHRTFGHNIATSPIFPWSLFNGRAPNLRRVELKECIIDLCSPLLRSLTALRVIDLSYDNAPTATQWVRHLRNMPLLQELYLQGAILPSRFHSSLDTSDVNQDAMPHIANLNIEAPLTDIALLVRYLPTPPKRHWTLTCSNASPGPDLEKVMEVLSCTITSIFTLSDGASHLLLAAREAHIFLSCEMPNTSQLSELGICIDLHTPSFHLWETLFPAVALELGYAMNMITSLEMILPTFNPSLLQLLRRAAALTTLVKLSSKMTRDLIPQLQSFLPSGGIALPALDSIVFTDDKSMWGWNYQSFLGFLRWRSDNGSPIRDVYFVGCLILEEVAKELMDLGVIIHGDLEGLRWQNL